MFKLFYPSNYTESVYTIDYEKLYNSGKRALIFDIDNTFVPHGGDATEESDTLFERLSEFGFKTFLLSNNGVERIERFTKNISVPYIDNAKKPNPKSYRKALSMLGVKKENALYIGDQVFTDILGANLCKIDSVLVKYIGYYDEDYKGKRRAAEEKILERYKKSKYYNSLGDIER